MVDVLFCYSVAEEELSDIDVSSLEAVKSNLETNGICCARRLTSLTGFVMIFLPD
jgi:hypothetical protein